MVLSVWLLTKDSSYDKRLIAERRFCHVDPLDLESLDCRSAGFVYASAVGF
jgi:hypothetical protein